MADFKLSGPGRKKLAALTKRLGQMEALKRAIAVNQAEEALDLIKQGFREEADPYGRRWPKRRRETKKTAGRKVLSGETSFLKSKWKRTEVGPGGFKISSGTDYARAHQKPRKGKGGRLKRPRRMMVPDQKQGTPRRWAKPLREAAGDAVEDFLTGGKL